MVMGGVAILYLVMSGLMTALADDASLPPFLPVLAGLVMFALLSFLTISSSTKPPTALCTVR